jgi:hypothetical protein
LEYRNKYLSAVIARQRLSRATTRRRPQPRQAYAAWRVDHHTMPGRVTRRAAHPNKAADLLIHNRAETFASPVTKRPYCDHHRSMAYNSPLMAKTGAPDLGADARGSWGYGRNPRARSTRQPTLIARLRPA